VNLFNPFVAYESVGEAKTDRQGGESNLEYLEYKQTLLFLTKQHDFAPSQNLKRRFTISSIIHIAPNFHYVVNF
jgi:hypothetical protein